MIIHANIFDQSRSKAVIDNIIENPPSQPCDLKNARQKANKNINEKGKMKAKKVTG